MLQDYQGQMKPDLWHSSMHRGKPCAAGDAATCCAQHAACAVELSWAVVANGSQHHPLLNVEAAGKTHWGLYCTLKNPTLSPQCLLMCKHGRPDELTVLGLAKTSRLRQAAWCQTGQEASRTLILLLALEKTPKVGRKDAGDPTSPNDVTQNGKGVRVCLAVLPELPGVEGCVNDGIDPLPHQLGQALRELGHILTDALFGIGDHFVHIGQLVIHLQRWAGGLVAGSDSGSFGSVSTDQVLVRQPAYICRKVP